MGMIILGIFKWLLIIIGIILGIVLLLILLVLFVPIRYQFYGQKEKEPVIKVDVSWLLCLIHGWFYDEAKQRLATVKIAGFQVFEKQFDPRKKKPERPRCREQAVDEESIAWLPDESEPPEIVYRRVKNSWQRVDQTKVDQTLDTQLEDSLAKDVGADTELPVSDWVDVEPINVELDSDTSTTEQLTGNDQRESEQTKEEPIEGGGRKQQVKLFWQFLRQDKNKGIFKHVMGQLFKIVKDILPKQAKGHIHYGLTNPSLTGYLYGGYQALWADKLELELIPNFDVNVLEGEFIVKGRVWLAGIVYRLLRLVFDPRIIRLWFLARKIKRETTNSKNHEA